MNFPNLRRYLLKAAAETSNPHLQNDMVQLLQQLSPDQMVQQFEDDEVMAPELNTGLPSQNRQVKGPEDLLLRQAMPEIQQPNPEIPETFGKLHPIAPIKKVSMMTMLKRAREENIKMSAYIKDTNVNDLPEKVQEDVKRFIPKSPKNPVVIHYGMMVRELLDRADPQNYKSAWEAVKKELDALSKDKRAEAREAFFKKTKDKYILLVNDAIVDGHHFLAKAKYFNVTNSLNVLDLTPARFQQ
jgi:hypothetical protein